MLLQARDWACLECFGKSVRQEITRRIERDALDAREEAGGLRFQLSYGVLGIYLGGIRAQKLNHIWILGPNSILAI